jgi:Ca2+-dependent lipid-binding protein
MCVAFGFALRLCEALADPWGTDKDDLNIDALLFITEKCTYHFLKRGHYPQITFNTEPMTTPKKLTFFNISAFNLPNTERFGKSDPYYKISIDGLEIGRTKIVQNDLNPTWEETFEVTIYDIRSSSVSFEIYDHDLLSDDDFLGKSTIYPDTLATMGMESGSGNQETEHTMTMKTNSPGKTTITFKMIVLQQAAESSAEPFARSADPPIKGPPPINITQGS